MIPATWLVKLLLAHLVTDFVLQPSSWVRSRRQRHFASPALYLHGFVTALVAWLLTGWQYWPVALVILVTHTLIDGWKSYRRDTVAYFIIDQVLHLVVIGGCWCALFVNRAAALQAWDALSGDLHLWKMVTAFTFVTFPSGIIIGQLTKQWRNKVENAEGLGNAGKWIGIVERIIVLLLVTLNQYSAIGLLVTAKGIIRFSEKDRQEAKTEYLVIGTLLSIGFAIVTGLMVK